MDFKVSKYVVISGPIGGETENDLTAKRMIFSTRKGMGITVTNYLLAILNGGQFESIPDHMFNILMYHEILVPSNEDELEEIVNRKIAFVHDVKAIEIELTINKDTKWDEDFINDIINQINERLSLPENRLHQVKLRLDMLAANASGLASLYQNANYFFKQIKYPCKIKIDALLRCPLNHADQVPIVEEDFITIAQFHFLVDLRKESFGQPGLAGLVDMLSNLEKNEAKTVPYLIINAATLGVLYTLRDVLINFNTLKKVNPKIVVINDGPETPRGPSEELEVLKQLSQMGLTLDLLQVPDCKYYTTRGGNYAAIFQSSFEFSRQWAAEPNALVWADNFKMEYYDTKISDQLKSQNTRCSPCVYLPVCGGRLDKNSKDDKDCPSFISNLVSKALVKYGISLHYT